MSLTLGSDMLMATMPLSAPPAFNVNSLTLSGYWPDTYTGSPNIGVASAGTSLGDDISGAIPATVGTTLNGFGTMDYIASVAMQLSYVTTDVIGTTAWSFAVLVYARSLIADTTAYANQTLFAPTNFVLGVVISDAGAKAYQYDAGVVECVTSGAPFVPNTWALVQAKWDGSTLSCRVNSGAWQTAACTSQFATPDATITTGYSGYSSLDALLTFPLFAKDLALSDADFDNILAYCDTRYGLSISQTLPTPVITSVDHDLDDTLGGSSLVITGTDFNDVTQVFFGSTPATSFVVDNDMQITAVVPAHVAGAVNVQVANAVHASVGEPFEFWSPETPGNITSFMESPDYSAGTWTARTGFGASEATFKPDDDPVGTPNFVAANLDRLVGPSTAWANLIGTSGAASATIACVLDVTDLTGTASNIICDDGFLGTIFLTPTPDAAFYYHTGGSYQNATTTSVPASGRMILVAERDSTGTPFVKITNMTSDTVTWSNSATVGNLDVSAAGISMGYFTAVSLYPYNGRIKALVTAKQGWTDTEVTKFFKWANVRHP